MTEKKINLKKNREDIKTLDIKYRAEIISKAIEVEDWMSSLICMQFADLNNFDEFMKFHYCFMEDSSMLTFNNRREILRRIIIVENYMIEKDRKKLDTDIQNIALIRNHLAHKPISKDFEELIEFDGSTISYFSFKFEKGKSIKEKITIDQKKFNEEIERMDSVISRFRLLEKIIEKRDSKSKSE